MGKYIILSMLSILVGSIFFITSFVNLQVENTFMGIICFMLAFMFLQSMRMKETEQHNEELKEKLFEANTQLGEKICDQRRVLAKSIKIVNDDIAILN